jgi:hypothetical protein
VVLDKLAAFLPPDKPQRHEHTHLSLEVVEQRKQEILAELAALDGEDEE